MNKAKLKNVLTECWLDGYTVALSHASEIVNNEVRKRDDSILELARTASYKLREKYYD